MAGTKNRIGTNTKTKKQWIGKHRNNFEKDPYSPYQNFLYKRAVYGLSVYSTYELEDMDPIAKTRVITMHNRTQMFLNTWKQKLIINASIELFNKAFPKGSHKCEFIEELRKPCKPDPYLKNSLTFKDLGISKDSIVKKLIIFKLLPKEFDTLTKDNLDALSSGKLFNY